MAFRTLLSFDPHRNSLDANWPLRVAVCWPRERKGRGMSQGKERTGKRFGGGMELEAFGPADPKLHPTRILWASCGGLLSSFQKSTRSCNNSKAYCSECCNMMLAWIQESANPTCQDSTPVGLDGSLLMASRWTWLKHPTIPKHPWSSAMLEPELDTYLQEEVALTPHWVNMTIVFVDSIT